MADAAKSSEYVKSLEAQIAALKASNQKLIDDKNRPLTFKVSEKGAISVYGMGRFPLTMYASQFDRLDKQWDALRQFRTANDAKLAKKGE